MYPCSPWQNPYVERLFGSIRRECLDHIIVLGENHLRRVLRSYVAYYNESRTHLSLAKDAPDRRAVERHGKVIALARVGGLHHRYSLLATRYSRLAPRGVGPFPIASVVVRRAPRAQIGRAHV